MDEESDQLLRDHPEWSPLMTRFGQLRASTWGIGLDPDEDGPCFIDRLTARYRDVESVSWALEDVYNVFPQARILDVLALPFRAEDRVGPPTLEDVYGGGARWWVEITFAGYVPLPTWPRDEAT